MENEKPNKTSDLRQRVDRIFKPHLSAMLRDLWEQENYVVESIQARFTADGPQIKINGYKWVAQEGEEKPDLATAYEEMTKVWDQLEQKRDERSPSP